MMQKNHLRKHQPAGMPTSPRLSRCKSERPAMSSPEIHTNRSTPDPKSVRRSKSTAKSRTNNKDGENLNPSMATSPKIPNKPQGNRDRSFVKFLQRGQVANGARPAPTRSPSAWALSPGRASPSSPALLKPPSYRRLTTELDGGGGGGVSGVLKYFRQKRVSPVEEEEFHRYRILHNRLLQWRFVNARAQVSMAKVAVVAEKKLFGVWLRIFKMRNFRVEKQIQRQRLQNKIKLYQIINSQICSLKEWAKFESKNSEAVGRLTRKLSAISISLPLVQEAKMEDVLSVYNAMNKAIEVMTRIETEAINFFPQVQSQNP
ncbi:hypothetical protein U1Q18_002869 [Sarracenia purpurea var. burkii]